MLDNDYLVRKLRETAGKSDKLYRSSKGWNKNAFLMNNNKGVQAQLETNNTSEKVHNITLNNEEFSKLCLTSINEMKEVDYSEQQNKKKKIKTEIPNESINLGGELIVKFIEDYKNLKNVSYGSWENRNQTKFEEDKIVNSNEKIEKEKHEDLFSFKDMLINKSKVIQEIQKKNLRAVSQSKNNKRKIKIL